MVDKHRRQLRGFRVDTIWFGKINIAMTFNNQAVNVGGDIIIGIARCVIYYIAGCF